MTIDDYVDKDGFCYVDDEFFLKLRPFVTKTRNHSHAQKIESKMITNSGKIIVLKGWDAIYFGPLGTNYVSKELIECYVKENPQCRLLFKQVTSLSANSPAGVICYEK